MRLRSIIVCAAAAPLLMAAAQPVRLQPSSPWDVDYAENSCRLIRVFGQGKTETKLAFESAAPGEMDMLIFGRPLATDEQRVQAKFLPVSNKSFDGRVAQTVTKQVPAILWANVSMLPADALAEQERLADERKRNPDVRPPAVPLEQQAAWRTMQQAFADGVMELEVDTRRNRPVILETGSLGDAMAAFAKCGRDSLTDWGVDPDVEDKIVRPVWAVNPNGWLFESDYPRDMLMRGKESVVAVRLLIDASGKITRCTPLSHFTEEEFNRITCASITARARFEPAELADGTKVPSYYTRRVIFQIAH
jgi:hypothetical protein